jgi:hypothetical protein
MTSTSIAITPSSDLISQQAQLELEMTEQGIERFRARILKAQEGAGRSDHGAELTRHRSLVDLSRTPSSHLTQKAPSHGKRHPLAQA